MITRVILLVLMTLVLMPVLSHAEFSRGSVFDYVTLEGQLTVRCSGQTTVIDCRDTFMEPWPYDYFEGPKIPKASSVELRADSGNGIQVAVASYNGAIGKSSEINLGVYSLLSRPLLKQGANDISFVIYNRNEEALFKGSFVVNVGRLPSRECAAKEIMSVNMKDCQHTYSACQNYFRSQNYCR